MSHQPVASSVSSETGWGLPAIHSGSQNAVVHPKYFVNERKGDDTKYDIAIIKVMDHEHRLSHIEPMKVRGYESKTKYVQGMVIGFPLRFREQRTSMYTLTPFEHHTEHKHLSLGDMYGMKGRIEYNPNRKTIQYHQS